MYLHLMIVDRKSGMTLPQLPCACASLRRAARAVSRMYDRELAAAELEMSQFTLLMTLDLTGEITQKDMARVLAMDSTTLTRTLRPLVNRGWIRANPGKDRREKLLSLSPAGRRKFSQAQPHWERAQARLRTQLGDETWQAMGNLLGQLAGTETEG
jgi:DNA-binding MarR family transcriptional regulator